MKVLVVEDDKVTSKLLSKILQPYGDCSASYDGESALEQFYNAHEAQSPYDLIFLDISLPGIDGQEVLSKIRDFEQEREISTDREVAVLMITGQNDLENVLNAHISGCKAYVCKPLEREEVVSELAELGFEPRNDDHS